MTRAPGGPAGPSLLRAGTVTYAVATVTLLANLVTGVVSARGLGPDGRGVAVALSTLALLAGFLVALGAAQSVSYALARRPADGPRLLTTWAVLLVPPTVVATVAAELLLPVVFPDSAQAVHIGRWFVLTIALVVALELNAGLLLGAHDVLGFNAVRVTQPVLTAVAFLVLWPVGALTVASSLLAPTLAAGLVLAWGLARSIRRTGIGPFDLRLGRETVWYGIRGHGVMVAANVTARLDVAILPAFVSVAAVGLYATATNVSLIVYGLTSTFAAIVLPAAAGDPDRAVDKVLGSLQATVAVAAVLALAVGLLAQPLLGLVYGSEFRAAAMALRLLLPGAVLFAGSSILGAGIYAAGRPFTATATQLSGVVVTVAGLLVVLPAGGGVKAAALVSSASYATVFVASLVAYKLVAGVPWRGFLSRRSRRRAPAR